MPSRLAYGFKARAERLAAGVRVEGGLGPLDRLDPLALARRLGMDVVALAELEAFGASPASIVQLSSPDAGFSAMTVCFGTERLIVYNERHPSGRRANSLAHELSHVVLEHPATPALFRGGRRLWDARMEEEADWLAGALLVPRDGAFAWLRNGGGVDGGAEHFGVSRALFGWRANQTGVVRQLQAIAQRVPATVPR